MFDYKPNFYNGIEVIGDSKCIKNWELNSFTKELMGHEWVKQFNVWAVLALPKQPACYMLGDNRMVVHPSISKEIRNAVEARSRVRYMSFSNYGVLKPRQSIVIYTGA